jgi:hypothetical protein
LSSSALNTNILTPKINQPKTSKRSLRDFGIGRASITEGGVGLFLTVGAGVAAALVVWAKGAVLRRAQPYQCIFEFPLASGISVGTPVRIRGVQVRGRLARAGAWVGCALHSVVSLHVLPQVETSPLP